MSAAFVYKEALECRPFSGNLLALRNEKREMLSGNNRPLAQREKWPSGATGVDHRVVRSASLHSWPEISRTLHKKMPLFSPSSNGG